MKRKYWIMIASGIAALAIGLFFVTRPRMNKPVDLLEAYRIAAKGMTENARLHFITSQDEPYSVRMNGRDGKRRFWNILFFDTEKHKQIVVQVRDGRIHKTLSGEGLINSESLIDDVDTVKINSEKAVELAIKKYGLLPGKNWAVGYHFGLSVLDKIPVIIVTGVDEQNQMRHIYFNAITGNAVN